MTVPGVPRVLVIGIGNTCRGDDAAGLAVAEWLRATAPPDVEVVRHEGEPISLLEEKLGRVLGRLPGRLVGYGIEGSCFATGATLSPPVREAVAVVSERLLAELDADVPPVVAG